jgi:hypothetical protein
MNLQNFWDWMSQGVEHVPTLGTRLNPNRNPCYISATTDNDRVIITAGNGVVQPPISLEAAFRYITVYLADPNDVIQGNRRYVIALYLRAVELQ